MKFVLVRLAAGGAVLQDMISAGDWPCMAGRSLLAVAGWRRWRWRIAGGRWPGQLVAPLPAAAIAAAGGVAGGRWQAVA